MIKRILAAALCASFLAPDPAAAQALRVAASAPVPSPTVRLALAASSVNPLLPVTLAPTLVPVPALRLVPVPALRLVPAAPLPVVAQPQAPLTARGQIVVLSERRASAAAIEGAYDGGRALPSSDSSSVSAPARVETAAASVLSAPAAKRPASRAALNAAGAVGPAVPAALSLGVTIGLLVLVGIASYRIGRRLMERHPEKRTAINIGLFGGSVAAMFGLNGAAQSLMARAYAAPQASAAAQAVQSGSSPLLGVAAVAAGIGALIFAVRWIEGSYGFQRYLAKRRWITTHGWQGGKKFDDAAQAQVDATARRIVDFNVSQRANSWKDVWLMLRNKHPSDLAWKKRNEEEWRRIDEQQRAGRFPAGEESPWERSSEGSGAGAAERKRRADAAPEPEAAEKTTFADIGGNVEALEQVKKFTDFIKNPGKYENLGDASSLRALLMEGPPGSGKTLFAKAIAGETGIQLLEYNGADFVALLVGSGANNLRKMLDDALKVVKEKGKVIIFIDEIDALAPKRGGVNESSEAKNTLNKLLGIMDGFKANKGIYFVAATNRKDMLDPAILRGGRFGFQLNVGMPDVKARADIFKKLIRVLKVRLAPQGGPNGGLSDREFDALALRIAKETSGLAGADLKHIVAHAILEAGYRGDAYLSTEQLLRSIEFREDGGEQRKTLLPEERKVLAYHEAGHAIAEHLLPYGAGVRKLTIVPHGMGAFGFMRRENEERELQFEAWMLDRMTVAMAGRAAEELFSGRRYNGVGGDFPHAAHYANQMVAQLGMSDLGPIYHDRSHPLAVSDATKRRIEAAVQKLMAEALARAQKLVADNREAVERVVSELLEHETLNGAEFERIVGPRTPQPPLDRVASGRAFSRP